MPLDKKGKNLDDLQDLNRAQIIRYLAMNEGCSRVDIAKATGLKQASITKIMHSLMENNVVVETGFTEGLKGRRSIGLSLNYAKSLIVGVKISWERLTIGLFDLKAQRYGEVYTCSFDFLDKVAADNVVHIITDTVKRLTAEHPNIVAVGVAVPGPFHRGNGSVFIAEEGRTGRMYYPFLGELRARIALPIVMDHDANAGALGYWWFRTNCDSRMALLYLLASEGIGGGVVSKGQIFTGQRGHSAEIGHLLVDNQGGRECVYGGHGCLDAYASSLAVERRAKDLLEQYPDSLLAGKRKIDIDRIFAAMHKGDLLAEKLIHEAGQYVGYGFASLIPIFDPDLIVIGDLMAGGGEILLTGINDTLDTILSPFYKKPKIVLADPDDDLVLLGSATIAIDYTFQRPTELLVGGV